MKRRKRRKRGSHTLPFAIDRVVPWGRTLAEYRGMFALTDADLRRRIVGCGDGPASFNAELTARRGRVVSIDPLYAASARAIGRRVEETFEVVMGEVRRNRDDFVWTHVPSIEELGWRRLAAPGGDAALPQRLRCRRQSGPIRRGVVAGVAVRRWRGGNRMLRLRR